MAARTMKMLSKARVSLLGVMLAGVGVSDAARETVLTTEGGITFIGVRYDDGRSKPYRIKFRQDDTRSLYMFNSASQVTDIEIGTEWYKVRRCRIPSTTCGLMERTCIDVVT